jgi:dTDP-4-amino-4,6-dideoxygalactose transaminase
VYDDLKKSGIQTKRYFYPPVHAQSIFQHYPMRLSKQLTETEKASRGGLALPLYSHMKEEDIDVVCSEIKRSLAYQVPHTKAV